MSANVPAAHSSSGADRSRYGWKAKCDGCDYWTGYQGQKRANRMVDDHIRTMTEKDAEESV